MNGPLRYQDYFERLALSRVRERNKFQYYHNEIRRHCAYFIPADARVLEVGCGTGELIGQLNAGERVGIDFSTAMIEEARHQFPNVDFRVMSAEQMTFEKAFDVIILSNLIGFVDDIETVFKQVRNLCHERSKVVITYYNHFWEPLIKLSEWMGIKSRSPDQNWLTTADLSNLLYLEGFEINRMMHLTLLPFRIPLLSDLFNRFLASFPLLRCLTLTKFIFARPIPRTNMPEHLPSVSIVIPARNEAGNIEAALARMPRFGSSMEVVFVEGHSTDETWQEIKRVEEKYKDRVPIITAHQDGKGKGDAVRKGFDLSSNDILMILDADLTVPPEMLPRFYDALVMGYGDFIMGSRLVYAMERDAMRFLNILGNHFFSRVFSWLLDQPIKDTLCGTKVIFRKDYTRLVRNRSFFGEFDPFGDYDLIFGAYKLNLKIVEIPVRYQARTYGTTNISRFRHGLILLRMCLFAAKKIKWH